jgi:hypothetical protein
MNDTHIHLGCAGAAQVQAGSCQAGQPVTGAAAILARPGFLHLSGFKFALSSGF